MIPSQAFSHEWLLTWHTWSPFFSLGSKSTHLEITWDTSSAMQTLGSSLSFVLGPPLKSVDANRHLMHLDKPPRVVKKIKLISDVLSMRTDSKNGLFCPHLFCLFQDASVVEGSAWIKYVGRERSDGIQGISKRFRQRWHKMLHSFMDRDYSTMYWPIMCNLKASDRHVYCCSSQHLRVSQCLSANYFDFTACKFIFYVTLTLKPVQHQTN